MTPDRWEQISRVYYAALKLVDKEQAAFIEEACDKDAELRGEVESLLAMHGQTGDFLSKPVMEELAQVVKEEPQSLIGRQLGSYQILDLLGAGEMGEVYKAKDTRLHRTVAIKVLPRHLSERVDLRQRFEREARAIASLSHPHICPLFDYLVMEYLEGETLSQRLKKGRLPTEQVLRYGIEMAWALDQAHRHAQEKFTKLALMGPSPGRSERIRMEDKLLRLVFCPSGAHLFICLIPRLTQWATILRLSEAG